MVKTLRRSLIAPLCAMVSFAPAALADDAAPAASPPAPPASPPAPQPSPDVEKDAKEAAAAREEKDQEVAVFGTKVGETTGSAHTIRPKELDRFEQSDPHQVLSAVPGVYFRGEDGFGLRPNIGMRGAISDRSKKITIMEDGVLLGPAPYSAPAAYYFPLITRMYSLKVIKGPSAIAFGPHTVAGAIDLVTAPLPDGEHVMVDASTGSYFSRKLHGRVSTSGDRFGVLVEAAHEGNEGFKHYTDLDQSTGYIRTEVMAKGVYRFGDEDALLHDLQLKLGFSHERSDETYLGLTDADFRADPLRRYEASQLDQMRWWRTQVVLTHTMRRGDDLELVSTAYRHDFDRTWRKVNSFRGAALYDVLGDPDTPRNQVFYGVLTGQVPPSTANEDLLIGPNQRRFVSQGFQTKLLWKARTGKVSHKLEVGARLHYDAIERVHTEDAFAIDGTKVVSQGEPTRTTADNEAHTAALAGWAMYGVTWGPATLTGGARVESIRSHMTDAIAGREIGILQQVLLPGGGAFVQLPKAFGLFAGVYQGFSPIPPGQSENPTPEKSINVEWGARWSPKKLVRVEVIGFHNAFSNLSNVCTFSTGCVGENIDQQFNAGAATTWGLEAYANAEIPLREDLVLPARVSYTFTRARFSSDFSSADPIFGDVQAGDTVPYVPAHTLSATAGIEWKHVGANVMGTYTSPMREVAGSGDPAEGEATDDYFLLDAAIHAYPLQWFAKAPKSTDAAPRSAAPVLDVYLLGRNLLDMRYIAGRRPFGARPGAPLWIQAGAKISL